MFFAKNSLWQKESFVHFRVLCLKLPNVESKMSLEMLRLKCVKNRNRTIQECAKIYEFFFH